MHWKPKRSIVSALRQKKTRLAFSVAQKGRCAARASPSRFWLGKRSQATPLLPPRESLSEPHKPWLLQLAYQPPLDLPRKRAGRTLGSSGSSRTAQRQLGLLESPSPPPVRSLPTEARRVLEVCTELCSCGQMISSSTRGLPSSSESPTSQSRRL